MMRRLLKQRFMASLHGRNGHTYRVYLPLETVNGLQAIYEADTSYGTNLRVQDMASIYLAARVDDEMAYQHLASFPWPRYSNVTKVGEE